MTGVVNHPMRPGRWTKQLTSEIDSSEYIGNAKYSCKLEEGKAHKSIFEMHTYLTQKSSQVIFINQMSPSVLLLGFLV